MTRPDIYIGLVGAAGTDLEPVKKQLRAQFLALNYACEDIKISALIENFSGTSQAGNNEYERVKNLMALGDEIRQHAKKGDGVISLVLDEIFRKRNLGETDAECQGFKGSTLFLIDSLKNPAEIEALDSCYARNYYTISVYAPEGERRIRLAKLIAKGKKEPVGPSHSSDATLLMQQDEGRKPKKLSQDVLGTFPRADFFVDSSGLIPTFGTLGFGPL